MRPLPRALVASLLWAVSCGQLPSARLGVVAESPQPSPAVLPVAPAHGTDDRHGETGAGPGGAGEAATSAPPNVLLIVTDDQPAGTLEVMPQLRRWFAGRGTTYSRAFVTTPLCCPSRATILTGRYAHNHGVLGNTYGGNLDPGGTLPVLLRQAGYRTALAGKLLNRWPMGRPPPGFDRWALSNGGYRDAIFNVDGTVRTVNRYSTHFVADRATGFLRWFERDDARPWFLVVAPFAPHGPFEPSDRYRSAPVPPWRPPPEVLEPNRSDKPPHVRARKPNLPATRAIRDGQLRSLMSVDDMVGGLMDELAALGERGRTLAIYVSDNGFLLGTHGIIQGKRLPYLPAIHVPLLARWPGHLPEGATDDRLVANVDIAATVLDAAGVLPAVASFLDGRSLLSRWSRRRLLLEYWQTDGIAIPGWAAFLTPTYHYIESHGPDGRTVTFREYYDLVRDPGELRNVLADPDPGNDPAPARLARLSAGLAAARTCRGPAGPARCP